MCKTITKLTKNYMLDAEISKRWQSLCGYVEITGK